MFSFGKVTQGNLLFYIGARSRRCYSVLHGLAAGYRGRDYRGAQRLKPKWHRGHHRCHAACLLGYRDADSCAGRWRGSPNPAGQSAGLTRPDRPAADWSGKNTWFLSYPAFGASVLLGVLAGQLLMSGLSPMSKSARLLAAGAVSLPQDWFGAFRFP